MPVSTHGGREYKHTVTITESWKNVIIDDVLTLKQERFINNGNIQSTTTSRTLTFPTRNEFNGYTTLAQNVQRVVRLYIIPVWSSIRGRAGNLQCTTEVINNL